MELEELRKDVHEKYCAIHGVAGHSLELITVEERAIEICHKIMSERIKELEEDLNRSVAEVLGLECLLESLQPNAKDAT